MEGWEEFDGWAYWAWTHESRLVSGILLCIGVVVVERCRCSSPLSSIKSCNVFIIQFAHPSIYSLSLSQPSSQVSRIRRLFRQHPLPPRMVGLHPKSNRRSNLLRTNLEQLLHSSPRPNATPITIANILRYETYHHPFDC